MFARRPPQGKPAAQVTKASVGGSIAAGSTRPTRSAPTVPGPAVKQGSAAGSTAAKSKGTATSVPSTLKRPGAPVPASRSARKPPAPSNPKEPAAKASVATSARTQAQVAGQLSAKTSDVDGLQDAAQLYSWIYMGSTLEDARAKTEKTILAALEARSQELTAEEESLADARVRFDAEQLLELYELLSHKESPVLCSVNEAFLRHETACNSVSERAMRLAEATRHDVTVLYSCDTILSTIDRLLNTTSQIEADLLKLPEVFYQEHTKTRPVLDGMLSIVRSRRKTLWEASQVVEAQKTIARLQIELDSLERKD